MGVQVFRGDSPFDLVTTLDASSGDFLNGTYMDSAGHGARADSKYIVTIFYAAGRGRATSSADEIPAFSQLGAGSTVATADVSPASNGLTMMVGEHGLAIAGWAVLIGAAGLVGAVLWRRRNS
jgi:hypothetical protein